MSQTASTYDRLPRDHYATPMQFSQMIVPHISERVREILEPSAGSGDMAAVFHKAGFNVYQNDIHPTPNLDRVGDFLDWDCSGEFDAIISNPPFKTGDKFIEHALKMTEPNRGCVAFLLRVDHDSAKGRRRFYAEHPAFRKKLVFTSRIAWFVEEDGKPKASPSENHAVYFWDWRHSGPPTIAYA